MVSNKQLFVLLTLVILTLLLRDSPYMNVLFIGRIWLFYFAILLFLIFIAIKFKVVFLWYGAFILCILAFVFVVLRLPFFAELNGVLIYFALWIIVIHKLIDFVRNKRQ